LNDLEKIYLLAHPLPLSPVSKLSPVELTDGRGRWEGEGEEPNHTVHRREILLNVRSSIFSQKVVLSV
jgi:hypothetical protein